MPLISLIFTKKVFHLIARIKLIKSVFLLSPDFFLTAKNAKKRKVFFVVMKFSLCLSFNSSQLINYSITQLINYSITQLLSYSITHSPIFARLVFALWFYPPQNRFLWCRFRILLWVCSHLRLSIWLCRGCSGISFHIRSDYRF